MKRIIVSHFGRYWLPIKSTGLAIAVVEWAEIDDFCPLCEARPTSGHLATCPLVSDQHNGPLTDLEEVEEAAR